MEIIEYKKNNSLSEIYQKSYSVFAFVKKIEEDKYQQCSQYVKCRDFLNDVVRGVLQKTDINIYGFKYEPTQDPMIDMDNISFLIKNPKKEIEPDIVKALKIINHYESIMGLDSLSTYIRVDNNTVIVTGSKEWLRSQVLTSLYTLIFRIAELSFAVPDKSVDLTEVFDSYILALRNEGKSIEGDTKYLALIYKNLNTFMQNYKSILGLDKAPYDPILLDTKISLSNFHNHTGIVSLLGTSNSYMPEERKKLFLKLVESEKTKDISKDIITIYTEYPHPNVYNAYNPQTVNFAFVNTVGNKRVACHWPVYCREQLVGAFRSLVVDDSDKNFNIHKSKGLNGEKYTHKIDSTKLRLLAQIQGIGLVDDRMQYHKRELFFAKKVLNYYEKLAGFKPSIVSTALFKGPAHANYAWLFTGSNDWMLSPILLTLYPLIIRAAKLYVQLEVANKNGENLPKNIDANIIKGIWETVKKYNDNKNNTWAHENIFAVYPEKIAKLLANAKSIFVAPKEKAFCVKDTYATYGRKANSHAYSMYFGINSFLKNAYVDKYLQKKINNHLEIN